MFLQFLILSIAINLETCENLSSKYYILSEISFIFDKYSTIFVRIDVILNSKLLFIILSYSSEFTTVLIPSHFLISSPFLSVHRRFLPENITFKKCLTRVHQLIQIFWRHWSLKFLNNLQQPTNRTPTVDEDVISYANILQVL